MRLRLWQEGESMEAGKHIELSLGQEPGEFRLNLDGIAISFNLNPPRRKELSTINAKNGAPLPVAQDADIRPGASEASPPDVELHAELNYYREVSKEIYEGLGKLAKDINLSIQDLSLAEIIQTAMGSPSEHLDLARTQVTDVLQMTEQATLNIMNLVEHIREDCQTVQGKLLKMMEAPGETEALPPGSPEGEAPDQGLWDQVLSRAQELDELLFSGDTQEISPAAVPLFSLSDILQLLLEFCTNEKVKQHLKAVQGKQDVIFRTTEAERAISLLAADAPQEDGFHQLPVEPVLNLLKAHCEDERVGELLTKMASSAQKLFPVEALPLESQGMEEEFAAEPSETQGNPEVASRWQMLHHDLRLLAEKRQDAAHGAATPCGSSAQDTEVQEVLETVDRITGSLSRIIETLSFQDLSGQRLLKILKIIRQLQVQVLT
ncbi:MAG: hypothetical protein WAU47_13595, partial [Desulfobaccales bacterium]